jgi:lysozyme
MFDLDKAADLLERHEGRRRYAYRDTEGLLTIGIGFNLDDVGLYDVEMDFILRNRIRLMYVELMRVKPLIKSLTETRQIVLVDMAYNMGITRLLGFKKFFAALAEADYTRAAAEMLDSKWAGQVGVRAIRLSKMMGTGKWAESV